MINRLVGSDYIKKYSLQSLKVILSGGTSINPKVQEKLKYTLPHVQVSQCYGKYHYRVKY